jgi:spermidine/putrescine transport system permease protein
VTIHADPANAPPLADIGGFRTATRRRRLAPVGGIYVAICLVVLFAPIAVLVLFSFNGGTSISLPFGGFSLRWYEEVLRDPNARQAFANSLLIAAVVTPASVSLGLVSAYSVARLPLGWRGWGLGVLSLPLVVPWLVVGIAALIFFHSLAVEPSLETVVAMQVVVTFPLVTVILYAALIGMEPNIEDAALDLGSSRFEVLRLVVLPQLLAPLVLGTLFAFIASLGNFVVTFFSIGYDLTVPIWAYSSLRHAENLPTVNAASTVLFAVNVVAIVVVWLVARRDPDSLGWL